MLDSTKIEAFLVRFWALVDTSNPDGCWLWVGRTTRDGYGMMRFRGNHTGTHRIAYMVLRGEPGKWLVCHHCDTPRCVNPSHLYLGTDRSNHEDKRARGRGWNPRALANSLKTHCVHGHSLSSAYVTKQGKRHCRPCHTINENRRRVRLRGQHE